jgi:2-haloacid dehalogenase
MRNERWLSFDCYGTLIDWEGGLRGTFLGLGVADAARAVDIYMAIEPLIELEGSLPYDDVLERAIRGALSALGLEHPTESIKDHLLRSLPTWQPFKEVAGALEALARAGWRLAVLSNTEPWLFEFTRRSLAVNWDLIVTRKESGSYKPAFGHWISFFNQSGADPVNCVHVAASLTYDIAPAKALGLRTVWIDRDGLGPSTGSIQPDRTLPDLGALGVVAASLVEGLD